MENDMKNNDNNQNFKNYKQLFNMKLNWRGKMKYFLILTTTMVTGLFAQNVNPETNWTYDQSTSQAFYYLEDLTIDGISADGDGLAPPEALNGTCYANLNTCDVIGAFNANGDCVGWAYAGFIQSVMTIPLSGQDGTVTQYLENGESAELRVYDAANGSILSVTPGDVLPGWSFNGAFTISGTSYANNTPGCTDASSCNQDPGATADDGSCWYPNTDCSCSDAPGSIADCAGVCNGTSWVSDCGCVASGNSGDGCDDCNGIPNGNNLLDVCNVCDADSSNDGVTCTGCTNSDADCFADNSCGCTDTAGNTADCTQDDGSCLVTVNPATNLTATAQAAKIELMWDAPLDSYSESLVGYEYDIYMDDNGDGVFDSVKHTTQIQDFVGQLDSSTEYCFQILAIHKLYGESNTMSNPACSTPLEATGEPSWRIQVSAEIDSYDQFQFQGNPDWLLYDTQNFLGVATDATYGYDPGHDAPDPPAGPGNYIKLFFDHPEWDVWVTHFTEDIVYEDHAFFSSNLTQWNIRIQSDVPGSTTIRFIPELNFGTIPSNYELYAELNGNYYRLSRTVETAIEFYMDGGGQQDMAV